MGKLTTLQDAVSRLVRDGDTVYLAGFTHLIPFAAGHEIIRQGRRDLTLARATPDLVYDQMIAAGCARKVVFSWAGNPGVGLLRALRRAAERGELEIEEYTHYQMVARLHAGATHLPFMPVRSGRGTDLPKVNPNLRTVQDPFTGEELTAVPALVPDVAVVHVQRCDEEGNAHIWGILGEQKEAAFAARRLILTAEEIVAPEVIRSDPNRVLIPGFKVDAVAHVPWCAHPSYAQGYYDRDNPFYLQWDAVSADETRLRDWLEAHVLGTKDHREYVRKLGLDDLSRLRVGPALAASVNYGAYGEVSA
jgi:glutaconate CoA-transferase subunit A